MRAQLLVDGLSSASKGNPPRRYAPPLQGGEFSYEAIHFTFPDRVSAGIPVSAGDFGLMSLQPCSQLGSEFLLFWREAKIQALSLSDMIRIEIRLWVQDWEYGTHPGRRPMVGHATPPKRGTKMRRHTATPDLRFPDRRL